ncbi:MAG: ABC transporter permease, partial [Candidatus Aminicenantes bacterium]
MIKNYLKIALRNIKRHKGFTLINIAGLAIGMACCFLIYTYVQYELSYDTFHKDYKDIYRVINRQIGNVYLGTDYFSTSPALMAPTMKEDFPEVLEAARVDTWSGLLSFGNKRFNETIYFADPEFFKIFTYPQLSGDLQDPIGEPFSMLITQEMAQRYFGDENPVGNTMRFNNQFDFTVTGVLQDTPLNSHMRFEFISSLLSAHAMMRGPRADRYLNQWNSADFHSYIKLKKGTDPEVFQEKLLAFKNQYQGEDSHSRFILQPLTSIHLHSHMNMEMEPNSDVRYLYIFSAVGFLIMLIACFNYMNLSTARSSHRAVEVGIRKVVGADRKSIIKQFLSESMISCSIALLSGLLLVYMFLPTFRVVFDRELPFSLFNDPKLIIGLFSIALFMGLLSGSYPAFFLSSINPIKMLRGNFRLSTKGSSIFRKSLVVIQFFISISLIIGALVIDRQRDFIKNRNLGFEKEHILYVLIQDPDLRSNCQRIKSELSGNPQILDMTVSMHIP